MLSKTDLFFTKLNACLDTGAENLKYSKTQVCMHKVKFGN